MEIENQSFLCLKRKTPASLKVFQEREGRRDTEKGREEEKERESGGERKKSKRRK